VFVLMQFDPGMEYRPDWGSTKMPLKTQANLAPPQQPQQRSLKGLTASGQPGGLKGPPKDDKS